MEALDELQVKYNKLAAEYSKLRSQVPVLKKAFTEEQSKNNLICEEIKSKDQQLRIAESEADSLNFRNQQLMCRVTVLQNELEALQGNVKKDVKSKNCDGPQFFHNFDEELSKKVAENATLIFTLNEYKERHELEVKALKDEIEALRLNNTNTVGREENKTDEVSSKINSNSLSNHKSMIGETIQKALEKQLFETQHKFQQTVAERDRLKQKLKLLEDNFKNGFMDLVGDEYDGPSDPFSSILGQDEESSDSQHNSEDASVDKEVLSRENAIKRCYRMRCDKLISEKNMFMSKAEMLQGECENLKSRLECEVLKKKSLEELLDKEKDNNCNTKEELSTTTASYEMQLSTMSDHLAGLNDVIEQQKEEILSLQNQLQKYSSLKGKK